MAAENDLTTLKGTKVLVTVEEALVDVLIVSLNFGPSVFQGALLDVTKKSSPYGISPNALDIINSNNEASSETVPTLDPKQDKFHALRQRFTYFMEKPCTLTVATVQRSRKIRADQAVRMRRLRPRKVLCMKCKGICDENSENVQSAARVKKEAGCKGSVSSKQVDKVSSSQIRSSIGPSLPVYNTRSVRIHNTRSGGLTKSNDIAKNSQTTKSTTSRPPVIRRTGLAKKQNAKMSPDITKVNIANPCLETVKADSDLLCGDSASPPAPNITADVEPNQYVSSTQFDEADLDVTPPNLELSDHTNNNHWTNNVEYQAVATTANGIGDTCNRMIIRKRKYGSQDGCGTCDETQNNDQFSDDSNFGKPLQSNSVLTTSNDASNESKISRKSPPPTKFCPVIKISYANPEGQDTIVKIPTRPEGPQCIGESDQEECGWFFRENSEFPGSSPASSTREASTKAARKALKKAKKEAQRKAAAEFGGESPFYKRRNKHHKHKLKHKRRHKSSPSHFIVRAVGDFGRTLSPKDDNVRYFPDPKLIGLSNSDVDCYPTEDNEENFGNPVNFGDPTKYDDVKNRCLRQKLSISLKRLNAQAYTKCSPKYTSEDDNGSSDSTGSELCEIPDFPTHEPLDKCKPLLMKITSQNVKRCTLENGREMIVGDVVWGKIHGFPWWPGKVLALTVSLRDNGVTVSQHAHVSWFGSSTSSYMPCNQLSPFLGEFKMRYNKKKRGPYKEAIRQATLAAQQVYSPISSPETQTSAIPLAT